MTNDNVPAISFRLSPEDYSLWKILAHEAGLTEGTYAKQMATLHIRAKQKEFGIIPDPIRKFQNITYPKATEPVKKFINKEQEFEDEEARADEADILAGDDELTFVEEPYIGEKDSPEFRELKEETNKGGHY